MFLAPVMLVFVGAGVVPLVLHWLSRSRQVEVRWGAMMFLEDVSPRRSRMNKLREWAVLLLRCLAIVLLAVAMARPVVGGAGGGAEGLPGGSAERGSGWLPGWMRGWGAMPAGEAAGGVRSAVLLVVDTSGSTSAPAGPTATRMDEIRESASRVLALLEAGELAGVMTAGVEGSEGEVFGVTADRAGVAARLATLASGSGTLDLAGTLEAAMGVIGRVPAASRTVVLITDRQAANYREVDEVAAQRVAAARTAAGVGRLVVLGVGSGDRENVSVREIEVGETPVLRGRATRVRVVVRNDGQTPRPGLPVRVQLLSADGTAAGEAVTATADLGPDATATAEAVLTFPTAGRWVVTAWVEGSGATFDDRLWRVVDVREGTRVLVVGSLPGPVEIALAPGAAAGRGPGAGGADRLVVSRSEGGRLPVFELERYAAVVIPHLQDLSVDERRALTQYVFGGGGLVVGLGPLTGREEIDALQDLWPATVGTVSPAGGLPQRAEVADVPGVSGWSAHVGGLAEVLPGSVVERWWGLRAMEGRGEGVMRLSGGSPLAVMGRFGAGRVLLLGTPLEGPWNDWYRSVGYVPVMQAMAAAVVSVVSDAVNVRPGEMLRVRSPVGESAGVVVEGPGMGPGGERARVERTAEGVIVRHGPVWRAGVYRVRFATADPAASWLTEPVVVRFPEGESDLRADDALQARVVERLGGSVYRSAAELTAGDLRAGREVWLYVLLLAVLCLGGEILLTRRWGL